MVYYMLQNNSLQATYKITYQLLHDNVIERLEAVLEPGIHVPNLNGFPLRNL